MGCREKTERGTRCVSFGLDAETGEQGNAIRRENIAKPAALHPSFEGGNKSVRAARDTVPL
jgi:hypothetical protein